MVGHRTERHAGRRRVVGGLLAVAASSALIACEPRITLPLPLSTPTAPRRPAALAAKQPPAEPTLRLGVDFGRAVRLEGVTIDAESAPVGGFLRLWLYWQATEGSQEDLRSIAQVIGAQGRIVAKEDDQVGGRRRFLSKWAPGERGIDEMRIRIAPSTALGEHGLAIGVLRSDNQTHVPVTRNQSSVAVWKEDAILVGTIEIVSA